MANKEILLLPLSVFAIKNAPALSPDKRAAERHR